MAETQQPNDPVPAETPAGSHPEPSDLPEHEPTSGLPLGSLLLVALVGLAGCAGAGWWGMHWTMDPEADRWARQWQGNREMQSRIGVVSSARYDILGTYGEPYEETMVFLIQGDKGTGQLVVTEFGMKIPRVELRTNGESTVLQEGVEGPKPPEHE